MRTRFAPSPTGPLHLGHAYSAMIASDLAQANGGTFVLRIEDIDQSRSKPEWEAQIIADLQWLGLDWELPIMRQSDRQPAYDAALDLLWDRGLLYPCTCKRRDIEAALSAPQEGAELAYGPDGLIYPGTCRTLPRPPARPKTGALRLDIARAISDLPETLSYEETGVRPREVIIPTAELPGLIGDVVLARQGMGTSYHLSVVVDDATQQITDVVRGADLEDATQIHVLLQALLNLPVPRYHHHRLIRDETGKRLAKRDDARALSTYRQAGATPADIRKMIGLTPRAT